MLERGREDQWLCEQMRISGSPVSLRRRQRAGDTALLWTKRTIGDMRDTRTAGEGPRTQRERTGASRGESQRERVREREQRVVVTDGGSERLEDFTVC